MAIVQNGTSLLFFLTTLRRIHDAHDNEAPFGPTSQFVASGACHGLFFAAPGARTEADDQGKQHQGLAQSL